MDTRVNQDVRDAIVEFATPTVAEWRALRAASQAWRLAVDLRVRTIVAMGQPKLCPWRGETFEAGAPLVIDGDEECLDDIRLHWTCDDFDEISRAVMVAFALDGAKDAVAEGGWCGPRPLRLGNGFTRGMNLRDGRAMSAVINANLVGDIDVNERNVADLAKDRAEGRLNRDAVTIFVTGDTDAAWELVSGIVSAKTTTLTLHFDGERLTPRWAHVIRSCPSLTSLSLLVSGGAEPALAAVADSGAPLQRLQIFARFTVGAIASFVDATPSMTSVDVRRHPVAALVPSEIPTALSEASKARMREMSPQNMPSKALRCGLVALTTLYLEASDLRHFTGWWWTEAEGPRESLRSLRITMDAALPGGTDLRGLFPNLESLTFIGFSETFSTSPFGVAPELPVTLTTLEIFGGGSDSSAFLSAVLGTPADPELPFLAKVSLSNAGDPRALIACAASITSFSYMGSTIDEAALAETIAALPRLRKLHSSSLTDCACAAGHAELRYISARYIGPNITPDRLARTCPRLHKIQARDVYRHAVPFSRRGGALEWEEMNSDSDDDVAFGTAPMLRKSYV